MEKNCGTCQNFEANDTPGYSDKGKCFWNPNLEFSPFWLEINRTEVFTFDGGNCPTYLNEPQEGC